MEALISINNQLRQPEAAVGVLTIAQRSLAMDLKVSGLGSSRLDSSRAVCRN